MKFIRLFLWLVPVWVPALFFTGCIKPNGEAFEAPPDLTQTKTEYLDTFSVSRETYRFDTLNTTSRQVIMAGRYNDGILGPIEAEGFFQFLPESYPIGAPSQLLEEYTTATLTLRNNYQYGKFGAINNFSLYPLTDGISGDKSYFINSPSTSHSQIPYLTSNQSSNKNTLLTFDANVLGKEILAKLKSTDSIRNDAQFLSFWKGFALKPNPENQQLVRFGLKDSVILEVFYRVLEEGVRVQKSFKFKANSKSAHYFIAKPDFTNLPWINIQPKKGLPAVESNGRSAVQGLSGLTTKLKIPGLKSWKESQSQKIKVFKAELEIKPDAPGSLAPPTFIRLNSQNDYYMPKETGSDIIYNDARVISLLQAGSTEAQALAQISTQVFEYSETENVYRCNISRHIQNFMEGKVTSDHINLYSAEWVSTVNRMLLSNGSVKLKLYYYPI